MASVKKMLGDSHLPSDVELECTQCTLPVQMECERPQADVQRTTVLRKATWGDPCAGCGGPS